jgi:hypothetical protein
MTGPKIFVPLFIATMGFGALMNAASSPRFAAFERIDVLRLLASGMCFGAAIAALVIFFGARRIS